MRNRFSGAEVLTQLGRLILEVFMVMAPLTLRILTTWVVVVASLSTGVRAQSSAPALKKVAFVGTIANLSDALKEEMTGSSWRPNCPVPLADLRLLTLSHHTPTGDVETGELVVHKDVAEKVVAAFDEIFAAGFPIERMARIDAYGGSDDKSMRANNTSAFNCRPMTGGKKFSKHAYGIAIDINPLVNPYVKRRGKRVIVEPKSGTPYVKRDASVPGLIVRGDVVYTALTTRGFQWGGRWRRVQDYQHFEARVPSLPPRAKGREKK